MTGIASFMKIVFLVAGPMACGRGSIMKNLQHRVIRNQWERLGVFLPEAVIHFQIPYCLYGGTEGHGLICDEMLLHVSEAIEKLSEQFLPWHQLFGQRYFSDLSFLFSSLVFGFLQTVRMKFTIVRDIVTTGNRSRLDRIIEELPDPCAELI
jgi:hypothetical protein